MSLIKTMAGTFSLSVKARYLAGSIVFAAVAIISGQAILLFELKSIGLAHCRRLNLQNIFFYNQLLSLQANQGLSDFPHEPGFLAPGYCDEFFSGWQQSAIETSKKEAQTRDPGLLLRLYADGYSNAEEKYEKTQMRLLLLLIIANVTSLLLQAMHLYEDSKEIESQASGG